MGTGAVGFWGSYFWRLIILVLGDLLIVGCQWVLGDSWELSNPPRHWIPSAYLGRLEAIERVSREMATGWTGRQRGGREGLLDSGLQRQRRTARLDVGGREAVNNTTTQQYDAGGREAMGRQRNSTRPRTTLATTRWGGGAVRGE
ncbi:hypothetical protein GGS26DRAFT_357194 [Hypomontagnella submonticulosa]|nr:hypothetical protein GGS26DRAFT_357194 [Hypomontagnella submonticulosa]